MERAHFGTDGLRGIANDDLSTELALALGRATARQFDADTFLVGRDTRRSGPLLQAAFSAGLAAEGADVVDLGVLTTPGVAYTAQRRALPAAVISASHNPFDSNGIKLFAVGGTKLSVEDEAALEKELDRVLAEERPAGIPATGERVGFLIPDPAAVASYRDHLVASNGGRRLDGLYCILDCANGAASAVAPAVFAALGARVDAISCAPDGTNINAGCGSTHPEALAEAVRARGADLGLAFDGDADRLLAVDERGQVADGDALIALFALDLKARGELTDDTVVVTVLTNLGFRRAMARHGITVRETAVGDRQILAVLEAEGLALGGEQSGHIVFRHRVTTGDGILAGVTLADLVCRQGRALSDLTDGLVQRVPQVTVNIEVPEPERVMGAASLGAALAEVEASLGEDGRVLLRPSGTEPLVRVMVEAPSAEAASTAAERLGTAVRAAAAALT
jgi:phosphoglucosamine mutase